MFRIQTKKPEVVAPVREFTYYYATNFHTYRARHVSDALAQLRADLSARAEREAVLVKVQ